MNGQPELVHAEDLVVRLGGRAVLDGVTLGVGPGDFVGVIGPNGAGKSTLMRALVGLHRPASGVLRLKGRALADYKPRDRARVVSYLAQDPPDAFAFTAIEVVLMGRYPHGARFQREGRADRERALRALAYVGLEGFEDRSYTELSGGERQLVLFARVLTQEAELLILDEPTANLDIRHQDVFFSMAWELAREGKGVLVSLHNLNVASQYCGRLALLDRGRLVAQGAPAEVLRADLLDRVYAVKTAVTGRPGSGSLSVEVLPRGRVTPSSGRRIHLIGGAGSAVNLTRELLRLGCRLTAGIAHEYDADESLWAALGIRRHTVGAFSRIGAQDVVAARAQVSDAEAVILCCFPVGPGNIENLRLASEARRLVIVQSGAGEAERSFFSDAARDLYVSMEKRARLMKYGEIVASLEQGAFWG